MSIPILLVCGAAAAGVVAGWESCNGPTGATVESMAQLPDGTILAGTEEGVFRMPAGASTWQPTGLVSGRVLSVFGASDGGVFAEIEQTSVDWIQVWVSVSFDGGETWQDRGSFSDAFPLSFAESADGTVWAGTSDGLTLVGWNVRTSWIPVGADTSCGGGGPEQTIDGGVEDLLFVRDRLVVVTNHSGVCRSVPQVKPRRAGGRRP